MNNLVGRLLVAKNMLLSKRLTLIGQPVQIIPTAFFTALTESLNEIDETERLYNISRKSIKPMTREFQAQSSEEGRKAVSFFVRLTNSAGWGETELVEINKEPFEAVFHIEGSSVTSVIEDEGKMDHVLRGLITGCLEEVFDRELVGTETKCIADGDDHCKIIVEPRE